MGIKTKKELIFSERDFIYENFNLINEDTIVEHNNQQFFILYDGGIKACARVLVFKNYIDVSELEVLEKNKGYSKILFQSILDYAEKHNRFIYIHNSTKEGNDFLYNKFIDRDYLIIHNHIDSNNKVLSENILKNNLHKIFSRKEMEEFYEENRELSKPQIEFNCSAAQWQGMEY